MKEWELNPLIIDSSPSSFVTVFFLLLLDQRFLDLRACDPLKIASCPFSSPPSQPLTNLDPFCSSTTSLMASGRIALRHFPNPLIYFS